MSFLGVVTGRDARPGEKLIVIDNSRGIVSLPVSNSREELFTWLFEIIIREDEILGSDY
jgi:hypothetical protein